MSLEAIIHEIQRFVQTKEYLDGLIVAFCGVVLEIIILLIAIPVVINIMHRIQTRKTQAIVDFYLFQMFHKITRMFLSVACIDDIRPILEEEQKKNPNIEIYGHFIYGNLENILFALKKVLSENDTFRKQIMIKTLQDFNKYAGICEKCIDELDRLTAILVTLPKVQKELFEIRLLFYPLRDIIYALIEHISDKVGFEIRTYDLQRVAQKTTERIDIIFKKRRNLIDSMVRYRKHRSDLWLLISLPYILLRRRVQIGICRLRKIPWPGDKWLHNYQCGNLVKWRTKYGLSIEQAAKVLDMSVKEYRDYEYGYRQPDINKWEPVKKHLRGEVDYSEIKKESESSD